LTKKRKYGKEERRKKAKENADRDKGYLVKNQEERGAERN
jgi:hypothetical protein